MLHWFDQKKKKCHKNELDPYWCRQCIAHRLFWLLSSTGCVNFFQFSATDRLPVVFNVKNIVFLVRDCICRWTWLWLNCAGCASKCTDSSLPFLRREWNINNNQCDGAYDYMIVEYPAGSGPHAVSNSQRFLIVKTVWIYIQNVS